MGIERDRFGREIEVRDEQDEMADYLRPPPGQEVITGRKPLDEALKTIRHELINMEQDRQMRKDILRVYKDQMQDAETTLAAVRVTAGEVLKVHAIIDAYLEKWHKKDKNDKG
jgi:hypothetical protein